MMFPNYKKINYYVQRNGNTLAMFTNEYEAHFAATVEKIKHPYDKITISMSNLVEVMGSRFFEDSFWSARKRRIIRSDSSILVNDLVNQSLPENNPGINIYQYSVPIYLADMTTPRVKVSVVQNGTVLSGLELHKKLQEGVPISDNFVPANGFDKHIVIIDMGGISKGKMWEFWGFEKINGQYQVGWGGIIDNVFSSIGIVPEINGEKWGATATSLPLLGGLILKDELESGVIPHMLAFAIKNPSGQEPKYIYPALRTDGNTSGNTGTIPAGQIFQFPEDIAINQNWCPMIKMMVEAVRDYGMILRDRSGNTTFYAECPHSNINPYLPYLNGKPVWEVIREFPFDKLQAVEF